MIRSAGILLPITSLPSPYGVGTLGKSAEEFVDFLVDAGQTYWQILPLGPTGFGNSPYQPLSSYAGNPYLIDLDLLAEEGYLTKEELAAIEVEDPEKVDYGALYEEKMEILRTACSRFPEVQPSDYFAFLRKEAGWLKEYAVFMAIKNSQKGKSWLTWPKELRDHRSQAVQELISSLQEDITFYERVQYFFVKQMLDLKKYANDRGIRIIGDLPFYMAADSIDVWTHPDQFQLGQDYSLQKVAGMPGQKWGNPLFDWDRMRQENYSWWIDRVRFQYRFCDLLRIDHFRGFLSYYAIDAEGDHGEYHPSVQLEPFEKLTSEYGRYEMIVEDLGELTPDFMDLVKRSGYPGMKILQYAFDPNDPGSVYMPFQYDTKNAVVYTGTHDNHTLQGWMKAEKARVKRAALYFGVPEKDVDIAVMRCAYASPCDLAVVQAQDLLRLDDTARINDPAGGKDNWCWRVKKNAFTKELAEKLAEDMKLYCRYNWVADEKKQHLI